MKRLLPSLMVVCLVVPCARAQEPVPGGPGAAPEIAELRAQITEQQAQIRALQENLGRIEAAMAGASDRDANDASKSETVPDRTEEVKALAVEAGFGKIKFNGLLQTWYQGGDAGFNDSFRIRRTELKFTGEISPRIRWTVMTDPAKALAVNNTFVTAGGTQVVGDTSVNQGSRILQDAFITLNLSPRVNLNVGQFKVPLSLEGLQSSAGLDTERALFASDRARGGTYGDIRDIGAMVYGPIGGGFDYQLGVFNGSGENQNDLDRSDQKALAGRLVFKPAALTGLQFGASGVWGNGERPGRPRRDRVGGELLYTRGPLTLKGEYMTGKDDLLGRRGYYGHFAYHFSPEWEGILRFDSWDPDTALESSATDVTEEDYVAGFNYFISGSRAKLQFNYVRKTFANDVADALDLAVLKLQTWW